MPCASLSCDESPPRLPPRRPRPGVRRHQPRPPVRGRPATTTRAPATTSGRCCYESGLVTEPLTYADDARVLEWNIGLTNMVARASRSISDLTPAELRDGAETLRAKLLRVRPRVVCFNGKRIYEVFAGHATAFGLQAETLDGMRAVRHAIDKRAHRVVPARGQADYFRRAAQLACTSAKRASGDVTGRDARRDIPIFSNRLDEIMAAMIEGRIPNAGRFCGYCYTPVAQEQDACAHCGTSTGALRSGREDPARSSSTLYRRMRKRESLDRQLVRVRRARSGAAAVHLARLASRCTATTSRSGCWPSRPPALIVGGRVFAGLLGGWIGDSVGYDYAHRKLVEEWRDVRAGARTLAHVDRMRPPRPASRCAVRRD